MASEVSVINPANAVTAARMLMSLPFWYCVDHGLYQWAVLVIIVAGLIIFIIIIFDVGMRFFRALTTKTCMLSKHVIIPDECIGPCPTGQTCTGTIKRSYFGGLLGTQDSFCNCVPAPAAATGGAAGGGSGGSGGGGSDGGDD